MDDMVPYVSCVLLGGAGAWIIGHYAELIGLVAEPNRRSSHDRPTANGGGIGILAAFLISSVILDIPVTFWIPATLLSLASFIGDITELSTKTRLLVQFSSALVLLSPLLGSGSLPILLPITSAFGPVSLVICLLFLSVFIVGTANFYNFMDGIDGISGITGAVAFGLIVSYTYIFEDTSALTSLSLCISLACLGFLPFNLAKTRVFMGDVGAVLLGFVFAGMVVFLSGNIVDFICLASFLFPFYADELTTMIVRVRDHDKLTQAHRKHFYQLLANEKRIAHWKVSVGYGIAQLTIGLAAMAARPLGLTAILSMLAALWLAFIWADFRLRSTISSSGT